MKQTAIQWFAQRLLEQGNDYVLKTFEQAKAMEKEQIRVAYMEGAFEKMRHLEGKGFTMPTEYYNETFKSE